MKKLLIFALCLLGICNARAEMMTAQEIILTEESHIVYGSVMCCSKALWNVQ